MQKRWRLAEEVIKPVPPPCWNSISLGWWDGTKPVETKNRNLVSKSEESYVTYIVVGQEKVRPVQLNREKSNLSNSFFPHNFGGENRGMGAFQWRRQRHHSLDFSLILIASVLWGLQMHSDPKRAKASCLLKWEIIHILILKLVLKVKS